jgi:two-component system response regulator YesN
MYRALLVDDERIVKLAIKSMIQWEALGLELAGTASNGNSALQMIERTKPDIIITDIKMPGMDGVELIRKLKEMEFDGEILVLSNYNDFELVREAMRYGAYDYVLKVTVKPEDFSTLLKDMLVKLEKKKGTGKNSNYKETGKSHIRDDLFRQVFNPEKDEFSDEVRELSALYTINPEDTLVAFAFKATPEEQVQTPLKLEEALQSIAEEFLAKSAWHSILGMDRNTVLLILSYRQADISLAPQCMAERLAELTQTYFNIRSGLVYSEPVTDYKQLFIHMRKCIRISDLFFYEAFSGKVLPMTVGMRDDEQFLDAAGTEAVENICRDLMKFEPDRVLEDFYTVMQLASGHALNPHHLKKRIKRIIREVDRKMIRSGCCSEEIFDIYTDDEELIYMAGTQARLSSKLEILVLKAQSRISAAGVNYRKEVREAVEYIERHVTERITLSGIARHVSLNDTYLCRIFKEDTGKSIISYINELKMKKAYGLLKKGDKMIKEAAAAVGIDDQFYFNRLFKKVYGITPREIKNR